MMLPGLPPYDAATQHVLTRGNMIGELAQQLYPGGIRLEQENIGANLRETTASLKLRKPLF